MNKHGRDFSRSLYDLQQKPNVEKHRLSLAAFTSDAKEYYNNPPPDEIASAYDLYLKALRGTRLSFIVAGRLPLTQNRQLDDRFAAVGFPLRQPIPSNERFPSIDPLMESNFR